MEIKKGLMKSIFDKREHTKELIITTIFIAAGVNSFTTGLILALGLSQNAIVLIVTGLVLSFGAIAVLFFVNIYRINKRVEFEGFIVYNTNSKELLKIPRYKISEDMVKYLKSAFAENKALDTLWHKDVIYKMDIVGETSDRRPIAIATHSGALFIELIEYCLIEKLSTHLADYFNRGHLHETETLEKKDIPSVLMQNRFLKLFTEEMCNREPFINWPKDTKKPGRIVYAYSQNGALYHDFDLVLPRKSKVIRINKNTIQIKTKLFSMTIGSLFGGFGTVIPSSFKKYYLGIENIMDYCEYKFNVEVVIKFSWRFLFQGKKWSYYNWTDDFIDKLDNYISKDTFFKTINWDTVCTQIICDINGNKVGTR
jgi:hypothetical protein